MFGACVYLSIVSIDESSYKTSAGFGVPSSALFMQLSSQYVRD